MIEFYDEINKANLQTQALNDLRAFLNPNKLELIQQLVNTWNYQGKAITYKELREAIMEAYDYGGSVFLGANDSPENWYEITEAEYNKILEEQNSEVVIDV